MARKTRTRRGTRRGNTRAAAPSGPKRITALPTAPTQPSEDIGDYTWLLYGERKIGKTSLASCFENPYFIMFEPGGGGLSIKQDYVQHWQQFIDIIDLLEKQPDYCATVIIDTGFMCYERCFEYCLDELGITSPRDEGWGGAWKFIEKEFRNQVQRIQGAGFGLVVTAHSELREITHRSGIKYDKVVTQLSKQAMRHFAGTMDIIAYYHYDENGDRVITIRGTSDVEAGSRCSKHFKYTNGAPVEFIPMGNTEKEAYENLVSAFNNKLQPPAEKEGSSRVRTTKRKPRNRRRR
jgi:hypothetical protein